MNGNQNLGIATDLCQLSGPPNQNHPESGTMVKSRLANFYWMFQTPYPGVVHTVKRFGVNRLTTKIWANLYFMVKIRVKIGSKTKNPKMLPFLLYAT